MCSKNTRTWKKSVDSSHRRQSSGSFLRHSRIPHLLKADKLGCSIKNHNSLAFRLAFGSILKEVIGEEKIRDDSGSDYDASESSQGATSQESKFGNESDEFGSETCKSG